MGYVSKVYNKTVHDCILVLLAKATRRMKYLNITSVINWEMNAGTDELTILYAFIYTRIEATLLSFERKPQSTAQENNVRNSR